MSEPIKLTYLPQIKVVWRHTHNDYHASFVGSPQKWGCAKTIAAAVGDLFITHGLPEDKTREELYAALVAQEEYEKHQYNCMAKHSLNGCTNCTELRTKAQTLRAGALSKARGEQP